MDKRIQIQLDGVWGTAEESGKNIPTHFPHRTPVPGLIDLSEPPFENIAPPLVPKKKDKFSNFDGHRTDRLKDPLRDYFWYRTTFRIPGAVPPLARLKVHKAMYGTRILLNRIGLGTHLPNFTPGYFNAAPALQGNGAENELLIRIGAARDTTPSSPINGHDHEKSRYIPGITDSVELILAGTPFIRNVQIAPDLTNSKLRLQVELEELPEGESVDLQYTIEPVDSTTAPATTGTWVATGTSNETLLIDFEVPFEGFRTWSPEDPFLYRFRLETPADEYTCRFGMRAFHFDASSGKAILNGHPYYLLGTNVCLYRFYEDEARGSLPWDRSWVRRLFTEFKKLNWNSFRFTLGPPPEFWYDLADEMGFIVQDEFPVWDPSNRATSALMIAEYTEWMRERWNHACVLIWDAQNETIPERGGNETSAAIPAVRHLDLSDRPWDNGWCPPDRPTDPVELHLYLLNKDDHIGCLDDLGKMRPKPWFWPPQDEKKSANNPLICNEYGWMWIDREGRPGLLSKNFEVYEKFIWNGSESTPPTADDYRRSYARTCALLTEYWRAFGNLAGIQHFCALAYSREDGHTADNLIDVAAPRFEDHFMRHMPDAFAPVAIVLDLWRPTRRAGSILKGEVILLNDSAAGFSGSVHIKISRSNEHAITSAEYPIEATSHRRSRLTFQLKLPEKPGIWQLSAQLSGENGYTVKSLRDLCIQ